MQAQKIIKMNIRIVKIHNRRNLMCLEKDSLCLEGMRANDILFLAIKCKEGGPNGQNFTPFQSVPVLLHPPEWLPQAVSRWYPFIHLGEQKQFGAKFFV